MRGRKPKPSAVNALAGHPGKRPPNADEPKPPPLGADFDTAPASITDSPHAVAEWQRLAPLLRQLRQVTEADRAALLATCLEWSRYLEATQQLAKTGMLITSPAGFLMPSPYLSIATKALAGVTKLWIEIGLTPSSRSRVKVAAAGAADAFSEFDHAPDAAPGARH